MALSVSPAGNFLSTSSKRLFEESSEAGSFGAQQQQPAKRVRLFGSPFGRCTPTPAENFASFQAATSAVAALLSLFPDMEEQAVIAVLSDCGDNIDAAIKRLSELRLNNNNAASSRLDKEEQQQAEIHGRQDQAGASTSGSAAGAQPNDWVEVLVQEMAAAKDMADARVRAARLLALFSKHLEEQGSHAGLLEKLQELSKENHILKRAVQIQNSKLQERSQQEQEIQQLRAMLGQYQEQVRTLELNNYSLALHLQKATNGSAMAHGHHHPDVC